MLFSVWLQLAFVTFVHGIPSSMDLDGNVYVPGNPNIIMRPQTGGVGFGGDASADVAVSVTGDVSFEGGVRIGYTEANCDGRTENALRMSATGNKVEFCDGTTWNELSEKTDHSDLDSVRTSTTQDKCTNLYIQNPTWTSMIPFYWTLIDRVTGDPVTVCCGGDGLCPMTCNDGIHNGDEEKVDCGGSCQSCECGQGMLRDCAGVCQPRQYKGDQLCDEFFKCEAHAWDAGDCEPAATQRNAAVDCLVALVDAEQVCGAITNTSHCAEQSCITALQRLDDLSPGCITHTLPAPYLRFPTPAQLLAIRDGCDMHTSCKDLLAFDSTRGDGIYRILVSGALADTSDGAIRQPTWRRFVDVYCDMTRDGGGWTLIGKTRRGDYNEMTSTQYFEMIANPVDNVNVAALQDPAPVGDGTPVSRPTSHPGMAFYNRDITNSFVYGGMHGTFTLSVDVAGYGSGDGRYLMKRNVDADNFDLWLAMRDATVWGDTTNMKIGDVGDGGDRSVNGYGSRFTLRKIAGAGSTTSDFDPVMGSFTHDSANDHSFMCESRTLIRVVGNTFFVCEHMGVLCDGYGGGMDLYPFTSGPELPAFMREGENGQTMNIWVR